jgi:alpha-mannosidase
VPLPADAPAKILLAALLGFEGEARADFTFAVPPLFRGQPAHAEIFSAASDEQLTRAVGWPVAPARAVSPAETGTGAVRLGLTAPVALPLARARLVFGDDATQELIRRLRFWTKDLAAPLDGVAACLAAVSREDFAAVCRELAALEQAVAARQPDRRAQTVTLVGHAHIDVNWLWTTTETIQCCHDTFRQALAFLDEFPEFVFSHSQALAYQYIERLDPPMFERIRQRVREGRWELLGGMYVESDTNLPSGEGLARSFLYGQRYFREKFGQPARVGWLPDNFGHVAQLPQLLARAGIGRFYAHRCQPRQGSYQWRGIDGTACHAVATSIYYGEVTAALRELPEQTDPQQQRAMWVYGVCDHGGGPTRRDITRALAYRELPGFPRLEFGTAESFFRAIEARGDELPVHHGELQYVYEGCYTSIAGIKAENRRCENTLFVAEQLAAFLTMMGGRYPAERLSEAWRAVVLNQFHDILCGSAVHESNRESLARYAAAREKAEEVRHSAWRELAARVPTRADAGQPVVVFNPLPRARTDIVAAEVFTHIPPPSARLRPWMTWGAKQEHPHRGQYPVEAIDVGQGPYPTVQLTDGDGRAVDAQIVDGKLFPNGYRCRVQFLAENLPACGYRAYYVKPTEPAPPQDTSLVVRETVLESRFFRVEVDGRTGHLTRLFDKRRNVEVLAPGGAANVLKLYLEKPHVMSAWDIGPISAVHSLDEVDALRVLEKGPLRAVIEVARHWNRSTFFQRILVHRDLPFLDFELDANWFELGGHTVDAPLLRVAFPLHVAGGVFTCDTPFAAVERPRDGREVPAQKWVDLSAPGSGGAALLNDSKYGHRCLDSTVEMSLLRAPYEPDPYPDQGPHHIRYRLFPHAGDWRAGRVAEAGLAFNIPLLASETPPNPTGALAPECGWFEIESDHCYLAAIKQAEDGDSWIVRLFEGHGHGGPVGIVWPFAPQRVERVDLLEDPLPDASPVTTTGCRLQFPIRAHEIVTLRIR